jgi:hypothetical protein
MRQQEKAVGALPSRRILCGGRHRALLYVSSWRCDLAVGGEDPISHRSDYDFVIVGSGAGGGPLACELGQARRKVPLLQAGGDHENYTYRVPVFHGLATEDEDLKWDHYVRRRLANNVSRTGPIIQDGRLLRIITAAAKAHPLWKCLEVHYESGRI